VAKLEQMGGGAQLHRKYSNSCDVQTSSMTNSQFLTSKFNFQQWQCDFGKNISKIVGARAITLTIYNKIKMPLIIVV
jgi:hypothetical protein